MWFVLYHGSRNGRQTDSFSIRKAGRRNCSAHAQYVKSRIAFSEPGWRHTALLVERPRSFRNSEQAAASEAPRHAVVRRAVWPFLFLFFLFVLSRLSSVFHERVVPPPLSPSLPPCEWTVLIRLVNWERPPLHGRADPQHVALIGWEKGKAVFSFRWSSAWSEVNLPLGCARHFSWAAWWLVVGGGGGWWRRSSRNDGARPEQQDLMNRSHISIRNDILQGEHVAYRIVLLSTHSHCWEYRPYWSHWR